MLYEFVIFIGLMLARIAAVFNRKTARYFSLRKGEIDRVNNYFSGNSSKVIWFHAASAGEFEQAKPIIEAFRKNGFKGLIAASFFSSSGYDAGLKYDKTDFCFNLPPDYRNNAEALLDCINPDMLIYSKYDVWRNLTVEASRRGVKLALISGTLPEKSMRHKFPVKFFLRKPYRLLDRIYAISDCDARRFAEITGPGGKIIVSGDTRFDRIKSVIDARDFTGSFIVKNDKPYLVAGSTYGTTEKRILSALKRLKNEDSAVNLVLVPHETDPDNIHRVCNLVKSSGFTPVCLSRLVPPVRFDAEEILVVDSIGKLVFLYNEADFVFIGGSFKGSVHSVLEPAAFGRPVLTGPYIANSYEALRLRDLGALKVCRDEADLYMELKMLLTDKELSRKASEASKKFFNDSLGAADKIMKDMKTAFQPAE